MVVGSSLFLFSRFNIHCSNLILTLLTSIHPIFSSGTFLSCPRYSHPVPFFHPVPSFNALLIPICYPSSIRYLPFIPLIRYLSFILLIFSPATFLSSGTFFPFGYFLSFTLYFHPTPSVLPIYPFSIFHFSYEIYILYLLSNLPIFSFSVFFHLPDIPISFDAIKKGGNITFTRLL